MFQLLGQNVANATAMRVSVGRIPSSGGAILRAMATTAQDVASTVAMSPTDGAGAVLCGVRIRLVSFGFVLRRSSSFPSSIVIHVSISSDLVHAPPSRPASGRGRVVILADRARGDQPAGSVPQRPRFAPEPRRDREVHEREEVISRDARRQRLRGESERVRHRDVVYPAADVLRRQRRRHLPTVAVDDPSSVMQCVVDSNAANAHTAPMAVAIEPTPNAPTKRRVRVNTTRRSAPRSKRGVARLTTPVWMTVKWGPGGGSTPAFASGAAEHRADRPRQCSSDGRLVEMVAGGGRGQETCPYLPRVCR